MDDFVGLPRDLFEDMFSPEELFEDPHQETIGPEIFREDKFTVYAGEAEFQTYLSSNAESSSYLALPIDLHANEKTLHGTAHIDSDLHVFTQMDGEDCQYAEGHLVVSEVAEVIVRKTCDQLGITPQELAQSLNAYTFLKERIVSLSISKEHVRTEVKETSEDVPKKSKFEKLCEEIDNLPDISYPIQSVVEYFYNISKDVQMSTADLSLDEQAFEKAVAINNFSMYLASQGKEKLPKDSILSTNEIKALTSSLTAGYKKVLDRNWVSGTARGAVLKKAEDIEKEIDTVFPQKNINATLKETNGHKKMILSYHKHTVIALGTTNEADKPYAILANYAKRTADNKPSTKFINKAADIPKHVPQEVRNLVCHYMEFPDKAKDTVEQEK